MHRLGARPTASIQIERLPRFVSETRKYKVANVDFSNGITHDFASMNLQLQLLLLLLLLLLLSLSLSLFFFSLSLSLSFFSLSLSLSETVDFLTPSTSKMHCR